MGGPPTTATPTPTPTALTPLSPRIVALWRLNGLLASTVLLVPALLVAVLGDNIPMAVRIGAPALVLAIAVLLAGWLPSAMYRRWGYAVTDHGLEIHRGIFTHQTTVIPLFRVQHIDLEQGPIERWRRVVELSISTASTATDASLPGIEPDQAQQLRRVILERALHDDGV